MGVLSSVSVCDPAAREVVRRQFDLDLVAGEDPDVVLPHLPRDRRENAVTPFELDAEHRARQGLGDLALDLDLVLLLGQIPFVRLLNGRTKTEAPVRLDYGSKLGSSRFVRILGPSRVTATVCSK